MRGIDVSANNGTIDWPKVARSGVRFAWAKATEGVTWVDPHLKANRDGARRAGIPVGLYHFARPDRHPTNAVGEARHFARIIGKLGAHELLPVLDLEQKSDLPPAALESWARTFNHELRQHLGRFPLLYSYTAFLDDLGASRPIGAGLWLANYGTNDGQEHGVKPPHPWKHVLVHQYTSQGRVDGIHGHVDLNDAASLRPLLARPWAARAARPLVRARTIRTRLA